MTLNETSKSSDSGGQISRKPLTIVSCATSLDLCLNDCSAERLILSSTEDLNEVHELRAACDAILVGAETLRTDNPRLTLRSQELKEKRMLENRSENPARVVLTLSGNLPVNARFFEKNGADVLVICGPQVQESKLKELSEVADIEIAENLNADTVKLILGSRGIASVLIEGGAQIIDFFLTAGEIDVFRIATAPFFVGDVNAPRLFSNLKCTPARNAAKLLSHYTLGTTLVSWYQFTIQSDYKLINNFLHTKGRKESK